MAKNYTPTSAVGKLTRSVFESTNAAIKNSTVSKFEITTAVTKTKNEASCATAAVSFHEVERMPKELYRIVVKTT